MNLCQYRTNSCHLAVFPSRSDLMPWGCHSYVKLTTYLEFFENGDTRVKSKKILIDNDLHHCRMWTYVNIAQIHAIWQNFQVSLILMPWGCHSYVKLTTYLKFFENGDTRVKSNKILINNDLHRCCMWTYVNITQIHAIWQNFQVGPILMPWGCHSYVKLTTDNCSICCLHKEWSNCYWTFKAGRLQ